MKSRFILLALTVLLCLGVFSGKAMATWNFIHGTSGHVEDEASVSFSRTGSGLEVMPAWEPSTWIHFAVPTIGETTYGAQYIALKFIVNTANNSEISSVRIYNGNVLVKTFTVNWHTLGFQSKTLDLGSVMSFPRGMGISVKITAGPDSGIDKFIFVGVGANFVPKP
jgi:hypothetical protein